MVRLVQRLLDAGVAYRGEDGSVYYAIAKFPTYGRLSQLDRREIKVGARVANDEYAKDDPRDFALWKKADPIDEQVAPRGTRRSAAGGQDGISSAPRCRSTRTARAAPGGSSVSPPGGA